ncbi:response regulator transcription factor [Runella zeae]|uniref:response regulator transcription factor n=1 Tax=Runella zeae TaxID=94255 RepID=UPI0023521B05|nr:response regulator transcription factor [Runella zeae]
MKVLLIEDEPMLLDEMDTYLTEQGYRCEKATTFEVGEDKIVLYEYDVIILDITLPGGNGLQLLQLLKKLHKEAGVLIVSAKDSLPDKLAGLNLGADDYMTKPFHLEELNARVNALVRRKSFKGSPQIVVDDLIIDPIAKTVSCNGTFIMLTRKEFELLLYFIINKNRVVSKQSIAEHLWGDHYDSVDNFDTVYVHTMNLRKKIIAHAGIDYIKTVYGMGYKFTSM